MRHPIRKVKVTARCPISANGFSEGRRQGVGRKFETSVGSSTKTTREDRDDHRDQFQEPAVQTQLKNRRVLQQEGHWISTDTIWMGCDLQSGGPEDPPPEEDRDEQALEFHLLRSERYQPLCLRFNPGL
jgi:hypothetical protein